MARDKRKEKKDNPESDQTNIISPKLNQNSIKSDSKSSTEVIAFGVILNGTLSVLDEKSYRTATAAALV